jgi:hypothetical protein
MEFTESTKVISVDVLVKLEKKDIIRKTGSGIYHYRFGNELINERHYKNPDKLIHAIMVEIMSKGYILRADEKGNFTLSEAPPAQKQSMEEFMLLPDAKQALSLFLNLKPEIQRMVIAAQREL